MSPALLEDGQIVYTEWRHMGMVNDGHLRMMNTDLTGMREAFGGELAGSPSTNSYLKAPLRPEDDDRRSGRQREQIANYQMVAIATSRDRTLQAGKLFLINLNGSEANSTATDLTPLIPGDRTAEPGGRRPLLRRRAGLGASAAGRFLVSWSDGPVESETLALAGTNAQFGIYVFDSNSKARFPIFDDPTMWDVLPRPLRARAGAVQDAGDAGVAAQRGGHDDRRAERLRLVAGRHQGEPDAGQRGQGPLARGLLG